MLMGFDLMAIEAIFFDRWQCSEMLIDPHLFVVLSFFVWFFPLFKNSMKNKEEAESFKRRRDEVTKELGPKS